MTTIDVPLRPAPAARLAADTRYVVSGFPVALAAFVLCLTVFTLGVSLAVVWIGVPLLVSAIMMSRGFAVTERTRAAAVLGGPVPEPAYRAATAATTPRRMLAAVADPQSWRDLTHAVLRCVPSTVGFSVVVSWWAAVAGGLTWALWGWALPSGPDGQDLPELLGFGEGYLTRVIFYLVLALPFALTLPAVTRAVALMEARFARVLLTAPRSR